EEAGRQGGAGRGRRAEGRAARAQVDRQRSSHAARRARSDRARERRRMTAMTPNTLGSIIGEVARAAASVKAASTLIEDGATNPFYGGLCDELQEAKHALLDADALVATAQAKLAQLQKRVGGIDDAPRQVIEP